MRWFVFSFFLLTFSFCTFQSASAQSGKGCQVYGEIYVTKKLAEAHFRVYVEKESDAFADVIVFKEDARTLADGPGKWYITKTKRFAKYRVIYVKDRRKADFSVFFTDEPEFAGCND
ncbi:hypothetical protein FUAX_00600 [Fulvitalea axinellae]|uniref:7(1) septoil knot domain-containing protein n=1 Tax=Fulvitalea axinellae TaxID=1182444 RepID=A0AAU9CVN9_9BACT|nr:hypothetical protein FUAX_00600 [Fulvitalea axinellae]